MFVREGRKLTALVGVVMALGLTAAACGDDDGAKVRESGPGQSGSASGTASGPASGSGSGSETSGSEECVYVGNSTKDPTAAVQVSLKEFSLEPLPASVPAGTIQFVATNEGEEKHEVVIVRFDGAPTDLPTDADGGVDEEQLPEGALIGEIEGFNAGKTCAAGFDLAPGKYVLFCNIVEEEANGDMESHYHEGMTTTFTVT
ncbi:MAG TPA: hypothetical protein VGJ86_15515 [Acidimicrobiales bacterium]